MPPVTWKATTDRLWGSLYAGMTTLERSEWSEALESWNLSGAHRASVFARKKFSPGFAMDGLVIIEE